MSPVCQGSNVFFVCFFFPALLQKRGSNRAELTAFMCNYSKMIHNYVILTSASAERILHLKVNNTGQTYTQAVTCTHLELQSLSRENDLVYWQAQRGSEKGDCCLR